MRIEIWSDVVCPWCYIGKRRLEEALEAFPHRDQVEVTYRSFELDPTAPKVGHESIRSALARKYGLGDQQAAEMMARVSGVAAEVGLTFAYADATHSKTVDAHRLLHLALEHGLQAELKEALLAAYFTRGESMGDHAVLRKVAADAGLELGRIDAVLASDEYLDAVHADIAQARAYGATGIPFFVVELFTQLLERAWADVNPTLELVGDGVACGSDGCPI
jgi:predicted DsbA family dithiol-disulfide isomerase